MERIDGRSAFIYVLEGTSVIISNSLNAVSINLRKQLEYIKNIHLVSISVIVLPRCLEQMEAIGD